MNLYIFNVILIIFFNSTIYLLLSTPFLIIINKNSLIKSIILCVSFVKKFEAKGEVTFSMFLVNWRKQGG